nr:type IV pilin-like G/H family protein [Oscillatoria sp. PCC 10802]
MGFLLVLTECVASSDNDTGSYRVLYSDEAIYSVKEINRNQTSYYQKNGVFADNLEPLLPNPYYIYNFFCSTKASPEAAFNYCSAGNIAIRGGVGDFHNYYYGHYIGGVFAVPGDVRTGEVLIADILCKANISDESESDPAHPIVQGNRIECGANTTRIDGWWPIVVGEDLPEANRSDELVAAGEYERALQVAQTIKHPYFKARSFAEIARSYAAAGKNLQAAEIFSLAETVAQTIQHSHSKDIALTDIARSYAAAGQYEQALRVASSIKDDSDKDSALQAIVRSSTEKGQYEQALRVASSIKSDNKRDRVLPEIARSSTEKGQYEQALRAASSIKSDDNRDDNNRDRVLEEIARSSTQKGQYEQALRAASSIKSDSDKDSALEEIARSSTQKGQYEQALRAASSIKSDDKRDSALQAIARYSVESINRAQQTYYSEHSTFANSFTELGLDIPAKTGNYEYSVSTTATSAFTYATPLKTYSSAYSGGVFAVPNAPGTQTETRAILCKSYYSSLQHIDPPTLQNGNLVCPPRTSQISPNSP